MSSRFGYPAMQGTSNEQSVRSYLYQLSDKLEYEIGRLQEMIPTEQQSETTTDPLEIIGTIKRSIEEIEAAITTINGQISSLDARVTALEQEVSSHE